MASVVEYRRIEELDALRGDWMSLLDQTPGASFFHSLAWLELYWRHFGHDQQLRVFATTDTSRITGILPLVVRREATRAGSTGILTYPLHDWGSYYSPIGPNPAATLVSCLHHVRGQTRDWDLLDLRWIDKHSDQAATPHALSSAGFPNIEQVWRNIAVIDIPETWDEYLVRRSSKFRNNLRRAEAAAARAGHIQFERYRPTGREAQCLGLRWDYFEECQALASRSWQGSSANGTTLSHPQVGGFFRELFGAAAAVGALDLNLLRCNGRLIAFTFNLVKDGCVTGLRIGFEVSSRGLSPGRLLLARSIQDSCERKDRMLDWGSESMDFKRHWLTRTACIYRYTHYPLFSLRGQLLRTKHWLFPTVSAVPGEKSIVAAR